MLFCSQQKVKMMEGCNLFAETAELTGAMQIFDKNQSLHSAGCTHSLLLAVHFVSQQHVQRSRELQYLQPRSWLHSVQCDNWLNEWGRLCVWHRSNKNRPWIIRWIFLHNAPKTKPKRDSILICIFWYLHATIGSNLASLF